MDSQLVASLVLGGAAIVLPFVWHFAQLLLLKEVEKLPSSQRSVVEGIVTSAVHFVEQTFPALSGADKRVQALSIIGKMLDEHKLSASAQDIEVLLEEAVFLMNGGKESIVSAPSTLGFSK